MTLDNRCSILDPPRVLRSVSEGDFLRSPAGTYPVGHVPQFVSSLAGHSPTIFTAYLDRVSVSIGIALRARSGSVQVFQRQCAAWPMAPGGPVNANGIKLQIRRGRTSPTSLSRGNPRRTTLAGKLATTLKTTENGSQSRPQ